MRTGACPARRWSTTRSPIRRVQAALAHSRAAAGRRHGQRRRRPGAAAALRHPRPADDRVLRAGRRRERRTTASWASSRRTNSARTSSRHSASQPHMKPPHARHRRGTGAAARRRGRLPSLSMQPRATSPGRRRGAGAAATEPAAAPADAARRDVPEFKLADRDGDAALAGRLAGQGADRQFLGDLVRALPPRDPAARASCSRDHGREGLPGGRHRRRLPRQGPRTTPTRCKIDYPLLIGEQDALDAAAAFGVEAVGFPFTIFTDSQGRIVAAHVGELTSRRGGRHPRRRRAR